MIKDVIIPGAVLCIPMKLFGRKWPKSDVLTLLGVIAAVLAMPGMSERFDWDSDSSPPDTPIRREPQHSPETRSRHQHQRSGRIFREGKVRMRPEQIGR